MGFDYSHDPDVPLSLQTRPLTMRNVSRVPLEFSIASQPPFSVDREDWILEPDEAGTVSVTFDPDYRDDAVSHEVRSKLLIAYADNPHVDAVEMGADIRFPNLDVSAVAVNFGSVLNDTTKREHITIRNSGHVPARYEWVFDVYDDETELDVEDSFASSVSHASRRSRRRRRSEGPGRCSPGR